MLKNTGEMRTKKFRRGKLFRCTHQECRLQKTLTLHKGAAVTAFLCDPQGGGCSLHRPKPHTKKAVLGNPPAFINSRITMGKKGSSLQGEKGGIAAGRLITIAPRAWGKPWVRNARKIAWGYTLCLRFAPEQGTDARAAAIGIRSVRPSNLLYTDDSEKTPQRN